MKLTATSVVTAADQFVPVHTSAPGNCPLLAIHGGSDRVVCPGCDGKSARAVAEIDAPCLQCSGTQPVVIMRAITAWLLLKCFKPDSPVDGDEAKYALPMMLVMSTPSQIKLHQCIGHTT